MGKSDIDVSGAFAPIETRRLLLRPVESADIDALHVRRNDPQVAAFQSWSLPYDRRRSEEIVRAVMAQSAPTSGEWWMLTIVDSADGEIVGDLAIHPSWEGRSVEIGYTLRRASWGSGFATEAVTGLVARLFDDRRLTRVHAMLHPDNTASARVLERTGFVFEGRTRLSYWVGQDNTDDLLYGLTRSDWQAWVGRPTSEPAVVRLVVFDERVLDAVHRVEAPSSRHGGFVSVDRLLVDALLAAGSTSVHQSETPVVRVVEADNTVVGIVVAEGSERDVVVDRRHVGRGIEERVGRILDEGLSETGR